MHLKTCSVGAATLCGLRELSIRSRYNPNDEIPIDVTMINNVDNARSDPKEEIPIRNKGRHIRIGQTRETRLALAIQNSKSQSGFQ